AFLEGFRRIETLEAGEFLLVPLYEGCELSDKPSAFGAGHLAPRSFVERTACRGYGSPRIVDITLGDLRNCALVEGVNNGSRFAGSRLHPLS
ncbi:MAG: hypothetical protein R6V72_03075, partial [Cyclobacterium sp.]